MAIWYTEDHSKHVKFSINVKKQIFSKQSEYQLIEVFDTFEFGRMLVMDGHIMVTEKDEFIYSEMMAHVPLAVHPEVRRVLLIGGGDGGVLRELCRYHSIEAIDMVEIDEVAVKASQKFLPKIAKSFKDPRLNLVIADGLRYVRDKTGLYDLIIVDSTDPFGPGEGLFSKEFYGNCYKALSDHGILVNQHESPFYKSDARAVKASFNKTRSLFPVSRLYQAHIPTYPSGHWLFGFFSKSYDPIGDHNAEVWEERRIRTRYYNSDLHKGSFALPNYVIKLLAERMRSEEEGE